MDEGEGEGMNECRWRKGYEMCRGDGNTCYNEMLVELCSR